MSLPSVTGLCEDIDDVEVLKSLSGKKASAGFWRRTKVGEGAHHLYMRLGGWGGGTSLASNGESGPKDIRRS
jgi:hypothetical protein